MDPTLLILFWGDTGLPLLMIVVLPLFMGDSGILVESLTTLQSSLALISMKSCFIVAVNRLLSVLLMTENKSNSHTELSQFMSQAMKHICFRARFWVSKSQLIDEIPLLRNIWSTCWQKVLQLRLLVMSKREISLLARRPLQRRVKYFLSFHLVSLKLWAWTSWYSLSSPILQIYLKVLSVHGTSYGQSPSCWKFLFA